MQNRSRFLGIALGLVAGIFGLLNSSAFAANELVNTDALRQKLGLMQYAPSASALSGLKIAVLDNGFAGFAAGSGQLPASAELIAGPQNAAAPSPHGLGMAEIIWAMTGKRAEGPKFYLVNTNGFTNFKAAVDFVVREQVDIVLYSQVWPFGSNFDGGGFINAEVNRATSSGILWVNAAGNFGKMVYNGSVKKQLNSVTQKLSFGDGRDSLRFKNLVDENELTVTLSWSDFADSENYNTSKDLDLFVYNSAGKLVGSSELIQRGEAPPATGDSRLSSHARESITFRSLDRDSYTIRVQARSGNFEEKDRFRVLLQNEKPGSIEFTDHTEGGEIFAPADNRSAITVGEAFEASAQGPTADGRTKPDVLIGDAIVTFSNGSTVRGSSSAAALFTSAVALMKTSHPDLSFANLMTTIHRQQAITGSRDGLRPASANAWPPIASEVSGVVPAGGQLMIHPNGHFVVMSPVDPLELPQFKAGHAYRVHPDDVMALDPASQHWYAIPVAQATQIQAPLIEFRRLSAGAGLWRTPGPGEIL
jgi:hypothetical protein